MNIYCAYVVHFIAARECPTFCVPDRLVAETAAENSKLEEERLVN